MTPLKHVHIVRKAYAIRTITGSNSMYSAIPPQTPARTLSLERINLLFIISNILVVVNIVILTSNEPLAKSDEEHKGANTKTDLSNEDTEEDCQANAYEHLADACLILISQQLRVIVLQDLIRDGLSVLDGQLCQFVTLPAILVHKIEDREDNQ